MTSADLTLYVIGNGCHARVVEAAARAAGWKAIVFVVDEVGLAAGGENLIAEHDFLAGRPSRFAAVLGIGSTRDQSLRRRLLSSTFAVLAEAWTEIRHPSAFVDSGAKIGAGTFIAQGANVVVGATLERHVIVNTGAIVDHGCVVGEGTHIAPGATLSGDVHLGAFVHVGTGAAIVQGVHIADEVVIGAGSVVLKPINEPCTTWVGAPARRVR